MESDKTSWQCFECCLRQCESSLLDWQMNWQKPPCIRHQTAECQQYRLDICFPARSASFFLFSSSLFIHHHFFTILCFSGRSSMFLITSRPFITNDTLHIALQIYGVQRKMGFASTLCSSILMKREIEGRKAFISDKMRHRATEIYFYCATIYPAKNQSKGVGLA